MQPKIHDRGACLLHWKELKTIMQGAKGTFFLAIIGLTLMVGIAPTVMRISDRATANSGLTVVDLRPMAGKWCPREGDRTCGPSGVLDREASFDLKVIEDEARRHLRLEFRPGLEWCNMQMTSGAVQNGWKEFHFFCWAATNDTRPVVVQKGYVNLKWESKRLFVAWPNHQQTLYRAGI